MDLKIDIDSNKTSDENSAKSPISTVKHFKKSMIVEYEKIEHCEPLPTTEDSQTSNSSRSNSLSNSKSASTHSPSSNTSSKLPTSFSDPAVVKKLKSQDVTIKSMASSDQNIHEKERNKLESLKQHSTKNKPGHKTDSKQSDQSKKKKSSKPEHHHEQSKHKKKLYCICRTSDTQSFMIACDNCDEWFHGDCVGVSQSLSKKIKAYYCYMCRRKRPSLSIRYKSKFQEILKNKTGHHSDHDSSVQRFLKEIKNLDRKEADLLSLHKPSKPALSSGHEAKKTASKIQSHSADLDITTSDPSKCYGKSNVPGEDILNFVSAISKLGHDAQTPSTSTATTSDYQQSSERKRKLFENNEARASRLITNSDNDESSNDFTTKSSKKNSREINNSESSISDNEEMSDLEDITGNEEHTDESLNEADSENDSNFTDSEDYQTKKKSNNNNNNKTDQKSTSSNFKSSNKSSKSSSASSSKQLKKKIISQNNTNNNNKKVSTKKTVARPVGNRKRNSSSKSFTENELSAAPKPSKVETKRKLESQQCLGPECINQALDKSKYCSEECGLSLAKNRLVHFLKSRIQQYNESPSFSKLLNESELERINTEVKNLRIKLKELEQKHIDLDNIIDQAKNKTINLNVEKEREQTNGDTNEAEIYCVTCGSLHTEKFALKHMDKCFNKIESQAFFGSFFKTHIDGKSMFCDWYNPQTKMYCKRLKAICPEHEKEKKVNDDEVCGCPLPNSANILEDSKEVCLAPKRTCSIHYKWEKLRRAHIDLERLRIWLKLEELLEQKRINETSLNQRASLLSILLHQTIVNTNQPDVVVNEKNNNTNSISSTNENNSKANVVNSETVANFNTNTKQIEN